MTVISLENIEKFPKNAASMDTFECTTCNKTFKKQVNLTIHQRMHDGTAFACDFCEKQFDRVTNLERHRIAHTFAKPFACNVDGCGKKFTEERCAYAYSFSTQEGGQVSMRTVRSLMYNAG
jgi:hypothetical protein